MIPEGKATIDATVRAVLQDVLGLSEARVAEFNEATPLFGTMPELDSMAVAGVLTEIEDRLGIVIDDDEVDGEMLETFGALTAFATRKGIGVEPGRMTGPAPRIDRYDWAGGREAMLRFGPGYGPTVIAALPLFEEANRTRAAMIDVLRRLAAKGIASALPDLPGTNESLVATVDTTLASWRAAFAAACARLPEPVHVVAWRGGALIDGEAIAASRWFLAPMQGEAAVRELNRLRQAGGGEDFGGNLLSPAMLEQLAAATTMTLAPLRVVRLESDPRPADRSLPGTPLWRGSEPATDPPLQAQIADDIAGWIATCAG